MNPGKLRHRIEIQKRARIKTEYGSEQERWDSVINTWSFINPVSGKDIFSAEVAKSEITHKIYLRYQSGISPSMRVKYQERIFHIVAVINFQEKNKELQLLCKELM